jgi:hypothetical protein
MVLTLDDGGFIKALLSTISSPSTPTPYLGYEIRDCNNALELVCLNDKFSH